jgi:hypothetical protein
MRNQSGEIPHHLRQEWDAVSHEVQLASIALHNAQELYNAVMSPRHQFGGLVDDPECEHAKQELNVAYKRYHASIVARTAIMDALNRGW